LRCFRLPITLYSIYNVSSHLQTVLIQISGHILLRRRRGYTVLPMSVHLSVHNKISVTVFQATITCSSLIFCILLYPKVPYGVKRFHAPCSSTSCLPTILDFVTIQVCYTIQTASLSLYWCIT
jgi:hypothetical protein